MGSVADDLTTRMLDTVMNFGDLSRERGEKYTEQEDECAQPKPIGPPAHWEERLC